MRISPTTKLKNEEQFYTKAQKKKQKKAWKESRTRSKARRRGYTEKSLHAKAQRLQDQF